MTNSKFSRRRALLGRIAKPELLAITGAIKPAKPKYMPWPIASHVQREHSSETMVSEVGRRPGILGK